MIFKSKICKVTKMYTALSCKETIWWAFLTSLACILGLAENFFFQKLITLGYVSLIRQKTTILQNFQLILPIPWHSTPRLKIAKITKSIKFLYFFTFFSTFTKNETKIRTETITTNIYKLIQRSFASKVKQVAILCGFAWRNFSALQTAEKMSALTELSA